VGRYKFIIGLEPNLAALEKETGVEILDLSAGAATWALLRVPADRSTAVKACFRGVCHAYDTEEEARRVWRIFSR